MKIVLPEKVTYIIDTLTQHGFEAYAVGGCVRDTMLGRIPMDWDITTSAKPEQVKALFQHTIDTGIQHGTVTVMIDHEGFEVTTYRIDGEYEDARHPKEVQFTSNLLEDLKRRDFTINAMAYNDRDGLVDAFDGVGDLERGVIRCVGAAVERFAEDALRMLRAVRFASQLGFTIEDRTREAIVSLAPNIAKVSAERIQIEMVKLLTSGHPELLRTAYETGLTAVFLPEFDQMAQTVQNNPHHCYDVAEHTIQALMHSAPEKTLRLALLFHDMGKAKTRTTDQDGVDHFHGHSEVSAELARTILRRLKFDNETIDRVVRLVRAHDVKIEPGERNMRFALNRLGPDLFPELFLVKEADLAAQSDYQREEKQEHLRKMQEDYEAVIASGACLTLKGLAVNGKDLIGIGMQAGRGLGDILQKLLEEVLEEPQRNTKEFLLEEARRIQVKGSF